MFFVETRRKISCGKKKFTGRKALKIIDLGYVGQVSELKTEYLKKHLAEGVVVFAPIGMSEEGQLYNINGDAARPMGRQWEQKSLFLNIYGVMRNISNTDTLIWILTMEQAENLIKENIVHQGMIPKVKACISSLKEGVKENPYYKR